MVCDPYLKKKKKNKQKTITTGKVQARKQHIHPNLISQQQPILILGRQFPR